jgi:hypothetical protein
MKTLSSTLLAIISSGLIALQAMGANPPCNSSNNGQLIYNSSMSNMQICNGTGWQMLGTMLGDGTGCHWEYWSCKGEMGNGKGNLYTNISGSNPNASSGAYCNLGEYIAGMVGDGVATGSKKDFGHILCCPANLNATPRGSGSGTPPTVGSWTLSYSVTASDASSVTLSWTSSVPIDTTTLTVTYGTMTPFTDQNSSLFPVPNDNAPTPTPVPGSSGTVQVTGLNAATNYSFQLEAAADTSDSQNGTAPVSPAIVQGSTTSASGNTGSSSATTTATSTSTGGGGWGASSPGFHK